MNVIKTFSSKFSVDLREGTNFSDQSARFLGEAFANLTA